MTKRLRLLLAVIAAVSACSSDSTGPNGVTLTLEGGASLLPCESRQIAVGPEAAPGSVRWRSESPGIMSVSSTGVVTAHTPGQARVFAALLADTTVTGSIQVTVADDHVTLHTQPIPADTIDTVIEGGIPVVLSWAPGCPGRHALVRFAIQVVNAGGGQGSTPAIWFESIGQGTSNVIVDLETDDQGSVTMLGKRSVVAGTFTLRVSEPLTGVLESIAVTTLPGAPHFIDLSVRDTAIYVGDSFTIAGGTLRDRGYNVLPVTAGYTSSDEGIAVVSPAGTATAVSYGRAGIVWNGTHVVANVSVVPRGTLAVSPQQLSSGQLSAVVRFELNGSGRRTLYEGPRPLSMSPRAMWHPTQPRLVMAERRGFEEGLGVLVVDTAGTVTSLLPDSMALDAYGPSFSRNGAWIYFTYDGAIYRVASDEAGAVEFLGGVPMAFGTTGASAPSLSPDDTRMVVHDEQGELRFVDAVTGAATFLGVQGWHPAWHPTQDVIAYLEGGSVWTISADGSNARRLTPPDMEYAWGVSWSPDGEWLATTSVVDRRIHIIAVSDGTALPLPFAEHFYFPSWR